MCSHLQNQLNFVVLQMKFSAKDKKEKKKTRKYYPPYIISFLKRIFIKHFRFYGPNVEIPMITSGPFHGADRPIRAIRHNIFLSLLSNHTESLHVKSFMF